MRGNLESLAAGVVASAALSPDLLPKGIGQRLVAACLLVLLAIPGWKSGRQTDCPEQPNRV